MVSQKYCPPDSVICRVSNARNLKIRSAQLTRQKRSIKNGFVQKNKTIKPLLKKRLTYELISYLLRKPILSRIHLKQVCYESYTLLLWFSVCINHSTLGRKRLLICHRQLLVQIKTGIIFVMDFPVRSVKCTDTNSQSALHSTTSNGNLEE